MNAVEGPMRTPRISAVLLALPLFFGVLWANRLPAGTPEQSPPTVRQIETLQSEIRRLVEQLDEIDQLHEEPARRQLVRRHWQTVQDYMRSLRKLLPPAPAGRLDALAAYSSAGGCRLAEGMDAGEYVSRTRDLLWGLREQLVTIHQASDPVQRLALLSQHAADAYHGLQLIRGYGWMYGAAAPVEVKDQPVPDSASTPAYLVRHYCGQCHAPPPPQLHSANEWSGVATKMVAHVGVAEIGNPREIQVPKQQEMTLILTYLEANACEVDD